MDEQQGTTVLSLDDYATETTLGDVAITLHDVYDLEDQKYQSLAHTLGTIVDLMQSPVDDSTTVQTVTIDAGQVAHLEQGVSLLVTEGFLAVCVLGVIAGLIGWRIFSRGWQHG